MPDKARPARLGTPSGIPLHFDPKAGVLPRLKSALHDQDALHALSCQNTGHLLTATGGTAHSHAPGRRPNACRTDCRRRSRWLLTSRRQLADRRVCWRCSRDRSDLRSYETCREPQSSSSGLIRARVSSIAMATHSPDRAMATAVNQNPASSASNASAMTPSDKAPIP